MAMDSRAVDIAEVFRDIVKNVKDDDDSLNTEDSLLSDPDDANGVDIHDLVDGPQGGTGSAF